MPPLYKHKEKGNKNKKSLKDTMLFFSIKSSLISTIQSPLFIEIKTPKREKPSHKNVNLTLARESSISKALAQAFNKIL